MKSFSIIAVLTLFIFACGPGNNENTTESKDKITLLSDKIASDSTNPRLYFDRANAYYQKSMFDKAYFDMAKVMAIDSLNPEYMMLYSDLSFRMNKVKASRDVLLKVREINPNNYEAAFKLAEIFLYTNNQDLSLKYLDTVLQKDARNTKALLMKGFNLKEKHDTTAAVNAFRDAINIDPKFYEAQMQLGVIMYAQKNKLCTEYFNNALQIKPNSEEAMYGLALWYQDHSDYNKAIQLYTDILQINPKNKDAYFNLGYIHHEYLKVYHEAIKYYSKAIDVDPNYSQAYYNRGMCYEYLGNVPAAKDDYNKALQLRHNNYPPAQEGIERLSRQLK
ncbi:MAG: tetratricopeptide repeat protein [Bacteroidetes bacterium]|jgi:tetratricopeptide (TPR) repeat protein|nr:tetratricopeptide repeat protein [Bacteroidota bacterium]